MSRASILAVIFAAACGDQAAAPDAAPHADAAPIDTLPPDAAWPTVDPWMATVEPKDLTQITIPGTHDSAAMIDLVADTSKTQDLTIGEQLFAGVRYFDIRLRRVEDQLWLYHGGVSQNLTFQQVLDSMHAFLAAYPSEIVLMSVKEETAEADSVNSFETDVRAYLDDTWLTGASIPAFADAQGKIVLVRRFDATTLPLGIDATDWADNATFDITDADAQLHIEDDYIVTDPAQKWQQVDDALHAANADASETLYLTYASGYVTQPNGLPSISAVSSVIDPMLAATVPQFATEAAPHIGVVVMDHVTPALVQTVFQCNQFVLTRPE